MAFSLVVTGKLSEFRRLNVDQKERWVAAAVLKEYARDRGQGFDRYWLLWLPKHVCAFVEIQQQKGFTVAVHANGIAVTQGDWAARYPEALLSLAVDSIEGV